MDIQGSFLVYQKKPSIWFFNLRHTLQFVIGLHHAGLNDKDISLVEEQDSGISVLPQEAWVFPEKHIRKREYKNIMFLLYILIRHTY